VTREHLPAAVGRPGPVPGRALDGLGNGNGKLPAGGVDLASVERDLVEKALDQADGNRSWAARLLGITRSQLYTKLARHELD
jgi:DNA-binding NtrC family response regulator